MFTLNKELAKELQETAATIDECRKKLSNSPEGFLLVSNGRYYLRSNDTRKYLGRGKESIIQALEEKEYYSKLLKSAEKKLSTLKKVKALFEKSEDLDSVFLGMDKKHTHLIEPYVLPSVRDFNIKGRASEKTNYKINELLKTKAGEFVRSKSELIIADKLYDNGIPYRYELNTYLGDVMFINPDFTVKNKRTGQIFYWEHFGMMDNPDYCADCQVKLENYASKGLLQGYGLIVTHESSKRSLNTQYIDTVIKTYLL